MPRGKEIEDRILKALKKSNKLLSTNDLSQKIGVSWHPVRFHCLRLQMERKIDGYKVGNVNVWFLRCKK